MRLYQRDGKTGVVGCRCVYYSHRNVSYREMKEIVYYINRISTDEEWATANDNKITEANRM